MAAVRSLRVSVKPDSGSDSDSESDKDAREAEPMEVEDGELEDEVSVSRSLKELLPDTSRRYENKAGSFITGIDVNSKEAIERKEKRAQRFHFRPEDNAEQRDVLMDKETMKKGNVVWLDDNTSIRALVEDLSLTERDSLLSNELRPAIKPFKGNKLLLRFATHDDKKELGAARRSRYYMKYGNPNYGGMRGVLSNSWKRRFHTRRIQRDYGDRVGERGGASRSLGAGLRGRQSRSPSPWSESDEMDYDLELKMISTPSPKKTKKMTMYADELDTTLKSIRNRVGGSKSASPPPKVRDVRQLLEEKRKGLSPRQPPPDVRQRLGKRRYSPDGRSPSPPSPRDTPPAREPIRDVHRRLGVANQDRAVNSSKDRKSTLWSRLGSAGDDANERLFTPSSSSGRKENASSIRRGGDGEEEEEEKEEEEEEEEGQGRKRRRRKRRTTRRCRSRESSDESDN
ncbi:Nuclear cap-binding protein subunit 3 [Dissostichus eleginoides]|uniref:Nuclear cap-binding protein subunit 3 n=1 Tax=Dissostichus eleginoides TaxID=100907 RepID=A0AAD9AZP0_DISEL|nr:Nuclear cap-binding protein subunit 3 [Dissostichus eleginoides]